MKRKKELIVILSSLLVIVLSVSVAYFTTKILGTGKEISVESADLKVIFTSGSGTINGTNIEPGWNSGENTFTVKNESNGAYKYNIIIKDLVNTFVTEGFLQYKITSSDGGYNMTDFADVPKVGIVRDIPIAYNIDIEKNITHSYKIEFRYINSDDIDQSEDMGKKLSGKIFIVKGTVGPTLIDQLFNNNPTISERVDFSTTFTTNTSNTLYKATENETDVYYFAGRDTISTTVNNWVKFGGFYWRIIRTNSNGSIRLLYSGTSPDTTAGYIGTSEFNTTSNSPKYVGYMYGNSDTTLEEARTNTNDSTVKTYIDTWYENNLTSYTNYLSNDAVYCNDRELESSSEYKVAGIIKNNSKMLLAYETNKIYRNRLIAAGGSSIINVGFKTYERLNTNKTPTYDCTNTKDAFSGNNVEAKLKYPIALMTADEIVYASGVQNTNAPMWYYMNSTYNSITGSNDWWLLSPSRYNTGMGYYGPNVYIIKSSSIDRGIISKVLVVSNVVTARPVTSLKSCVQWKSGDGSAESPYEIIENGGC